MDEVLLNDSRRRWVSYAWALGTGIVFMLSIFPVTLLLHGALPDSLLNGDVAAHAVGQRAYFQDGWHWPLLKTNLLDWPAGVSIALTDSIPLVALPLKLFRGWLAPGFTAIQFWLAFCYVLQPLAAVFALRSAGETRLVPAVAVTLFAISMPTFVYRHTHAALSSHFVLLVALGAYFRTTRDLRGRRWLPVVVLPASLLIHPYLAVMTLAVLAAAPVTLALRQDRRWRAAALTVGAALLVTGVVAPCLGYAATDPTAGFGLASMNALSPFYPNYSRFFGRHRLFLDATGSQYEGYQFLGTGLLLLLGVFLVAAFFSTRVWFLRRHWGMALACLALTALALSNVVYVGTHKVFEAGAVPGFMQQLRSSGRLFWPVAYTALLGGVASVARLVPSPAAQAILLATAWLQVLDAHDLRKVTARDLRAHGPAVIDPARLQDLVAHHAHLTILPTFGCGADARPPEFMQVLLASSRYGVAANTMYVARFSAASHCDDSAQAARPLAPGELRVFFPWEAQTGPGVVPDGKDRCRRLDVVSVCTLQARLLEGLPPVAVPSVRVGADVPTGVSSSPSILGPGWYLPEPRGTWTLEKTASVVATLVPPPPGAVSFQAKLRGFAGVRGALQPVDVSVNGHRLATWQVVADGELETQTLVIPHDALVDGAQDIRFDVGHPTRPSDFGATNDTRELGVFVEQLRFENVGS